MVHYYTQRGMRPSDIFNASEGEKAFLFASMEVELDILKRHAKKRG